MRQVLGLMLCFVRRSQLSQSPLFRPTSPSSDSEDEDQERYLPLDAPSPAPRREDEEDDGDDSGDELAAALTSRAVITSPPAREPVASTSTIDKVKGPQRINAIPKSSTLRLAVPCQLFLFDKPTGVFMTLDERVQAEIHEVDGGFWLMVRGEERIWVSQGILNESTINFSDVSLFSSSSNTVLIWSAGNDVHGVQLPLRATDVEFVDGNDGNVHLAPPIRGRRGVVREDAARHRHCQV